MVTSLELLLGILACFTAALIFGGPWWPIIRRQFNFQNRVWPYMIICLIMGMIVPSIVGYVLLMLHIFVWFNVAIINAIIAGFLYYYFKKKKTSVWRLNWTSEKSWINYSIFFVACLSILWRINWLIQDYSARSYDSAWHLAYTLRGIDGISPTGYFSIYPLGMHGLLASWCTFFDLTAMWLWLPMLHVVISVGIVLIFARMVSPNEEVSLLVFSLITWASINPLALYTTRVIQPLPQGFAFTVMIFILILLSRKAVDRGWTGFGWIGAMSIVSLHNLTALYAAVVVVAFSIVNHSLSNDRGKWPIPNKSCIPDLAIGLCLPLLVGIQIIIAGNIIWLSGIESQESVYDSNIQVEWDGDYTIIIDTFHELEFEGETSDNASLSYQNNSWVLIPHLPTGINNSNSIFSMTDAQDSNIHTPQWLTVVYNPLKDLQLEFTITYQNLSFIISPNLPVDVSQGCIHASSVNEQIITNCSLENGTWIIETPDSGSNWIKWELEYNIGVSFQDLGTFEVWSTETPIDVVQLENSLPELPENVDDAVELEGDFGVLATLSWQPSSDDCPSPAKSKTIKWSDGAKLLPPINSKYGYGLCSGLLEFSIEEFGDNFSVVDEYQFEIEPYSDATIGCYSEKEQNLVSVKETTWDSSGYFTGELVAKCIIQNKGNVVLESEIVIPQNDVDRMDLAGMQPHSELKLDSISFVLEPASTLEFDLNFELRGIEYGTIWDVPLAYGNYTTIFSLPVPNEEGEIGTKQVEFGGYVLDFIKWKPHSEWLEANYWWFAPLAIVHLCVIFDRRFDSVFRSLAAASLSLQFIQSTGLLAYPADWAQQRIAHFLIISMPLALVEFPRVWLMWFCDKYEIDKIKLLPEGINQNLSSLASNYFTPIILIAMIELGGPQITSTVMHEVSWDVAESVDEGDYAIDMKTAFMGDVAGPNTHFISASTVISKWGVGDSNLASWRCNVEPFSIIITDTNRSDSEIKEWLDIAISEDSRRWSLEKSGQNWEHWVSIPAIEVGTLDLEIGGGDLELYWDTNFSHGWYHIDLDVMMSNSSMDDGNYIIRENSVWKACNPNLGVVSPMISYLAEVDS